MSYASIETALMTLLHAVTGFSATNVTSGDYRCLGTGQVKAIVCNPGPFRRANIAPGLAANEWMINIELFIPFQDEISTIASAIRTQRQNVIDQIDKYPTLNRAAGVQLGVIDSGEEPEIWQVGTRRWWRQLMRVSIKESVSLTYSE